MQGTELRVFDEMYVSRFIETKQLSNSCGPLAELANLLLDH